MAEAFQVLLNPSETQTDLMKKGLRPEPAGLY